jgi:hypothetical protein
MLLIYIEVSFLFLFLAHVGLLAHTLYMCNPSQWNGTVQLILPNMVTEPRFLSMSPQQQLLAPPVGEC